MASTTIQGKIYDALKTLLSAEGLVRNKDLTIRLGGNTDFEITQDTIWKTLQVTIQQRMDQTADITIGDPQEQFDAAYNAIFSVIMAPVNVASLSSLGVRWIQEVEGSPEFDVREEGSDKIFMRVTFGVRYWHDARSLITQTT